MIQLNRDYLLFETPPGKIIPCSAELVAVELIGEAGDTLDPELIRQAAAAVLHYFKKDLGCTTVTVGEFSRMLEQALEALGVRAGGQSPTARRVGDLDLAQIASAADKAFEMAFFQRLRTELRRRLVEAPEELRCHGLRACVKELVGARRWSQRCQALNDQIVEYLRDCLQTESANSCQVVIR